MALTPVQFKLVQVLTDSIITMGLTIMRVKDMEEAELKALTDFAEAKTKELKARMDAH